MVSKEAAITLGAPGVGALAGGIIAHRHVANAPDANVPAVVAFGAIIGTMAGTLVGALVMMRQ